MSNRNALDKVIAYFSPQRALARDQARFRSDVLTAKNGYDAAGGGRRNTWFRGAEGSVNTENRAAIVALRGRHRELIRNNPYAARAVEARVSNTIGGGIVPGIRCTNSRKQKRLQSLLDEWLQECDADGVNNLFGLESLIMRAQSESGEALVKRVMVNDPDKAIPLKIRVMEGDFLDHNKEGETLDGGKIIQGVQFDKNNNRVGYWLFDSHPGEKGLNSLDSRFYTVEEIAHIYEVLRPGQVRGIPAGVSAYMRMKGLDDFQDARIEQQKIAACLVGVITQADNEGKSGDVLPDRLEPGMFPKLGYGQDVTFNTPPSVSGHGEFISTEQHAIAAAYGITYEALTGNLKGTSFSSGKMGFVEFGRNIERWRWNMIVPQALKKIEKWILDALFLKGENITGVSFEWTPPRREMIDPTKEIPAAIKAVRAGLKSMPETLREWGFKPQQQVEDIAEFNKLLDQFGVVLDSDPRKTTNGGQFQVDGSNEVEPDEQNEE